MSHHFTGPSIRTHPLGKWNSTSRLRGEWLWPLLKAALAIGLLSCAVTAQSTVTSPNITSVSPGSGAVGTAVVITGANFGATQGTSTVTFGGVKATPKSWSGTSIVVPVPAGAVTGNVVVTVGGQSSNGSSFKVMPLAPSIAKLSPGSGAVGTAVVISGANFGATQGASTVTFGGVKAAPTNWSGTSIVVRIPTGAVTGGVVVTVGGQASNGSSLTVRRSAPSITSLSPSSG